MTGVVVVELLDVLGVGLPRTGVAPGFAAIPVADTDERVELVRDVPVLTGGDRADANVEGEPGQVEDQGQEGGGGHQLMTFGATR